MNKTCVNCHQIFVIDEWQTNFLTKISPVIADNRFQIPAPSHCPTCRFQRRLAQRNQIYVASQKAHNSSQELFSMFPGGAPFPIIPNDQWWDERGWSPEEFGREIDFTRPFFEQWSELRSVVPHPAINATAVENSEYSNNCSELKNCYFCFDIGQSQDCIYLESAQNCRDCIDCSNIRNSELCNDCVACLRCYQLQSSDSCTDCSESFYLLNCRSCKNCFGCVNLRQREYCIYNQQYSRLDYLQFLHNFARSSYSARTTLEQQIRDFFRQAPHPSLVGTRIENCTGNHLHACRNVHHSFMAGEAEDSRFVFFATMDAKSCMDYTIWGQHAELCYECIVCGDNVQRLAFCFNCWLGANNLFYCDSCHGSSSCFGCVCMRKRTYAILNKIYSKAEYEKQMVRLISHMRETGEWGEFFPLQSSAHPYNLSLAQRHFPITKESCQQRNLRYFEIPPPHASHVIAPEDLPDGLPDSTTPIVVTSRQSGRPFRITSNEIKRYQQLQVPLPRLTYDERMDLRAKRFGSIHLIDRFCAKSSNRVQTVYPESEFPIIWEKTEYDREYE